MSSDFWDFFKKYDFSFIGSCLAIFVIGVLNLYSATHALPSEDMNDLFKMQIIWFTIAIVVAVVVSFFKTDFFVRYAYTFYAINIFILILVLILGHTGMGAQRWIGYGPFKFQPSEFMKVTLVLALARWFSKHDPDQELGFKELIVPAIIVFVPAVLVIVQPDLGTGLMLCLIFAMIAFFRKLKWKTIIIILALGIAGSLVMYNYGLKEYQQKRIITFLDPDADAKGSGYNAIQSKIAIGSGQFFGKGYKKSSQASLSYLPENHTDFIFSIFNEEHGFFGSLVLISLYLILFMRFIWLAGSVTKIFNSIAVIGVMSIFFWHTFINMSMVTGILPIVGIPLPLMSYGGSSLLTFGICTGLVTSISNSKNFF